MDKAMSPQVLLSFWMILACAVQGAQMCLFGQYLFNGVCELCPANCSICHSASVCSKCKAGYYGESCAIMCNSSCRDNECDKSTGVCITCSDGYFKDTNKNCLSCPSNCSLCFSDTQCTSCKIGFKGRRCQEVCTNCQSGTACDKWTGECIICKQGLTGAACDKKCDTKCSVCQRLHADDCIACSNDKYGETCEIDCSTHCVNKTCDDANGICTHGCQVGYWGTLCKNMCMAECASSRCDRQNGSCLLHNPRGDIVTDGSCPNGCSCDTQGICRECNPESEFICGKQCPRTCQKQICFRNTSCLLTEEDLDTQPPKQSAGAIVLYLVAGLTVALVTFLFSYIYYRRQIRRDKCCRSRTTGNLFKEVWCRCAAEEMRTKEESSAFSKKKNNGADITNETALLQSLS